MSSVLVSFDAFRNEYLNRNVTDYMNELRFNNTRAEFIRNIFPTKTYPNHHSIATGVFSEQHGVMANELYDHVLRKKLSYSSELFEFKNEIIPIWVSITLESDIEHNKINYIILDTQ